MKWGWYATMFELAQSDLMKLDSVYEKPIHEILTFLAHKKDRAELESHLRDKHANKLKTRI